MPGGDSCRPSLSHICSATHREHANLFPHMEKHLEVVVPQWQKPVILQSEESSGRRHRSTVASPLRHIPQLSQPLQVTLGSPFLLFLMWISQF